MTDIVTKPTDIIGTDDIVKDIKRILVERGIETIYHDHIITDLLITITARDDKLFNYAYKLGRASA